MKKRTILFAAAFLLSFAAVGQGALERGVGAEGKGLDDLAESYYRQAADTNREAALRLGMLLERRERYLEAGSWLARGDSGAVAMAHIARCHTELGRWSDAKQAAEKAVELADESDKEVRSSAMASSVVETTTGLFSSSARRCRKTLKTPTPYSTSERSIAIVETTTWLSAPCARDCSRTVARRSSSIVLVGHSYSKAIRRKLSSASRV